MILYLDIILGINIVCNGMILLLTAKLMRRKISFPRLICSVFVATLIVPLALFYPNSFVNTFYFKVCYSIFIMIVTFGATTKIQLFKNVCMFYFVSFTIGGGLLASQFMTSTSVNLTHETSVGFLMIGFPIVLYFTKSQLDNHVNEKINYDQLYSVTITINGQSFKTTAYLDSGNQLVDPLTNRPVIICDEAFLSQFFHEAAWHVMKDCMTHNKHDGTSKYSLPRLYMIPYRAVGMASNFLYAIKPENVLISYGGDTLQTNKLFIGIQFENLSGDNRYHCLLHPKIIHQAVRMAA